MDTRPSSPATSQQAWEALPRQEALRVARQTLLPGFGIEQQVSLHNTRVLVIGAGGLGCPLLQQIAAAGVGHIVIMDDDVVSWSNLHRQILFGADDVGQPKADVAARRLRQIQPGITVQAVTERFTAANALQQLEEIDVLVDGSDTFATKFLAADVAEMTGTPLVWGSVLRFQGDIALWWSGPGAPAGGVGMRDLFPAQPDPDSVPDCATAGVLGVTTSVVAGLMATELIWFSSAKDTSRVGRLMRYDATAAEVSHFAVPADPRRKKVTSLDEHLTASKSTCAAQANSQASPDAEAMLLNDHGAVAIDVREHGEKMLRDFPFEPEREHYHLPTSMWSENPALAESLLDSLANNSIEVESQPASPRTVWVYCASGKRSASFIESFATLAKQHGLELRNVIGGVNAWNSDASNARFFP